MVKKQTFLLMQGEQIKIDGVLKTVDGVQMRHDRHYGQVVVVSFADASSREYLMRELVEVVPAIKEGAGK